MTGGNVNVYAVGDEDSVANIGFMLEPVDQETPLTPQQIIDAIAEFLVMAEPGYIYPERKNAH